MTLEPTAPSTKFNLARNANNAEIAVYTGNVVANVKGARAAALKAGSAASSIDEESPQPADIAQVQRSFAALHCPDETIIAQAMPQADPVSGGGHGGAGFLGTLLALGAIAAAVGHGGGGGSSASSASQPAGGGSPSPQPSRPPTPTPSASSLPTPTPSATATATPTPTPTPSPTGILILSTTSLSFSDGSSGSQNFDATDPLTKSFSATPADPTIVSVSEIDRDGHTATFSVTPLSNGSTSIVVTDGAGGSGTVSATVGGGGRMLLRTPAGLIAPTEIDLMAGSAKPAFVQEYRYMGSLRAQSSNPSVATVEPPVGGGPAHAFMITGRVPGVALVTIADDRGSTRVVKVVVSPSIAPRLFRRP